MNKKILLVEYDIKTIDEIKEAFPYDSFNFKVVEDGLKAKEMLKSDQYDMVISAAMLPKFHGFQLSEHIDKVAPDTKTIIISGVYKGVDYKQQAISQFKADDFFEKPLKMDTFKERVFELMDIDEADLESSEKEGVKKKMTDTAKIPTFNKLKEEEAKLTSSDIFGDIIKDVEQSKSKNQILLSNPISDSSAPSKTAPKKPAASASQTQKLDLTSFDNMVKKPEQKKVKKKIEDDISKKLEDTLSGLGISNKKTVKKKAVPVQAQPTEPQTTTIIPKPKPTAPPAPSSEEKYDILGLIARGGMAEIYKAKKKGVKGFKKVIALKKILSGYGEDDKFIEMFVDEAKIAAELTHPNIVQIYDFEKKDDTYLIAMEYVLGKDLRKLLKRTQELDNKIPEELSLYIICKTLEALSYAHNANDDIGNSLDIVHRDISPPNILLSYNGEVKLTDFGVSKAANKMHQTISGALKGKLLYMSPEQARGDRNIDARSDLYSVGVVLFEMLTGKKLFLDNSEMAVLKKVQEGIIINPGDISEDIDPELERIVLKSLAKDREERYQTANEMIDDLEHYLSETFSMQPGSVHLSHYIFGLFKEEIQNENLKIELKPVPAVIERLEKAVELLMDHESPFESAHDPSSDPEPVPAQAPHIPEANAEEPISLIDEIKADSLDEDMDVKPVTPEKAEPAEPVIPRKPEVEPIFNLDSSDPKVNESLDAPIQLDASTLIEEEPETHLEPNVTQKFTTDSFKIDKVPEPITAEPDAPGDFAPAIDINLSLDDDKLKEENGQKEPSLTLEEIEQKLQDQQAEAEAELSQQSTTTLLESDSSLPDPPSFPEPDMTQQLESKPEAASPEQTEIFPEEKKSKKPMLVAVFAIVAILAVIYFAISMDWFSGIGSKTPKGPFRVLLNDIEIRDNITYQRGEETPFTGFVEQKFSETQLKEETEYKSGLKSGIYKQYYKNGKIKEEDSFLKGKKNVAWKTYGKKGNRLSLISYRNGQKSGKSVNWNDKKQTLSEIIYKNDKQLSAKKYKYHPENGQIKETVIYQGDIEIKRMRWDVDGNRLLRGSIVYRSKKDKIKIGKRTKIQFMLDDPEITSIEKDTKGSVISTEDNSVLLNIAVLNSEKNSAKVLKIKDKKSSVIIPKDSSYIEFVVVKKKPEPKKTEDNAKETTDPKNEKTDKITDPGAGAETTDTQKDPKKDTTETGTEDEKPEPTEAELKKAEEEKIKREEARKKKQAEEKKRKEEEKLAAEKKAEEERLKAEEEAKRKKEEEEENKRIEEARLAKLEEEKKRNALKVGDLVSDVDTLPVPVNTPMPILKKKLLRKIPGESVQIIISLLIDENGNVRRTKFAKRSGIPEIDLEISRLVSEWKFKPATKYEKRVKTWFSKPVTIKK